MRLRRVPLRTAMCIGMGEGKGRAARSCDGAKRGLVVSFAQRLSACGMPEGCTPGGRVYAGINRADEASGVWGG